MRPDRSLGVAEFAARYQLQPSPVADGAVKTHQALARGGAAVLVHFLEDSSEAESMLRRLDALEDRSEIREILDVAGTAVVVTRFMLDFSSLDAWLRERVGDVGASSPDSAPVEDPAPVDPPPAPEEEPAPEAQGSDAPGEFTRLFQAPAGGSDAEADSATEPPSDDPSDGPGEFTRLFQAPSREPTDRPSGDVPEAEGPAAAPPPPEPRPDPGPGEFTRLFQAPQGSPSPSGSKPAPPPPEAPRPPEAPPQPPSDSPPAEEAPPPTAEPGGFTRLFEAPTGPAVPPEDPPPPARTDRPAPPPSERAPSPPAAPGPPASEKAPSEEEGSKAPPPSPPATPGGMNLPQPPAAPPARPPGRFTQQFQAPAGPPTPSSGSGSPGSRSPESGPGEFTRLFRGPEGASSGPTRGPGADETRAGSDGGDYLARLRREGPSPGSRPAPAPPPPPGRSAPPPPSERAGPSDFTRVVAGHSRPPTPAAPSVPSSRPAPPPPPPKDPSRRTLILGLAGIFAVVVLVLAGFGIWALATSGDREPPADGEPTSEVQAEAPGGG